MKTINVMKSRSFYTYMLALCAMPLLSGCITLRSDTPPPAIYRLDAQGNHTLIALNVPAPTILMINEPSLPAGFTGENMVLHFDGGRRQDHYAGAFWSDDIADLLREYIVAHGRATFPDLVLDTAQFGLAPDYSLNINILDFQPVYDGAPNGIPELRTHMRFALMDSKTNSLLTDLILERSAPASANNLSVITSELESQLQDILSEAFTLMAPQIK